MIGFIDKVKKNKKEIIALLVVAIIFFIYHQVMWNDLRNNGVLLTGLVKSQGHSSKSSLVGVKYTFEYMGKKYEGESNSGVIFSSVFIGKYFPVMRSKATGKSTMLITPHHFETFNIPFPDSLKWVLPYINN